MLRILDPLHHLSLTRLPQGDGVEEDMAVLLANNACSPLDFGFCKRVERVWWLANARNMGSRLFQAVKSHCGCEVDRWSGGIECEDAWAAERGVGGVLKLAAQAPMNTPHATRLTRTKF